MGGTCADEHIVWGKLRLEVRTPLIVLMKNHQGSARQAPLHSWFFSLHVAHKDMSLNTKGGTNHVQTSLESP